MARSKARLNYAVSELHDYSLVEVRAGNYSFHAYVHEWTLKSLSRKADTENKSELQPVLLGDENLGPNGDKNSREIGYEEIVFRPLCIHH